MCPLKLYSDRNNLTSECPLASSMPSNIAFSSLNLWIFQGSVALPKYEPTDQPLIVLNVVVLVCILLASDKTSLIPFPFLLASLMCSVVREKSFRKTLLLKLFKNFFYSKLKKKLC